MKTISFDIGIKNMAYCIFDCSSSIDILDWKVLNLNEQNSVVKETCNALIAGRKQVNKICGKKAKYRKEGNCYCETHAKSSKYLIPIKDNQFTHIKKQKVDEILKWGNQHFLFLEKVSFFPPRYCFKPIKKFPLAISLSSSTLNKSCPFAV